MKYKTTNILRLTNLLEKNIQKQNLFHSWDHLLIAFSGGQDSAFCLLVLYLLDTSNRAYTKSKPLTQKATGPCTGLVIQKANRLHKKRTGYTGLRVYTDLFTNLCRLANLYKGLHKKVHLNSVQTSTKREVFVHASFLCPAFLCYRSTKTSLFVQRLTSKAKLFMSGLFVLPVTRVTDSPELSSDTAFLCKDKWVAQKIIESYFFCNPVLIQPVQVRNSHLTFLFVDSYTLLWCNHFWQKDAFFTMEHVSKLAFSKNYTTYFFTPIQKIVSEQNARHWRHKVTQRSSLFICETKPGYKLQKRNKKKVVNLPRPVCAQKATGNTGLFANPCKGLHKKVHLNSVQTSTKREVFVHASFLCPAFLCTGLLCVQGHNKSDRAETILFNLIRGAGISGISTLHWKQTFYPASTKSNRVTPKTSFLVLASELSSDKHKKGGFYTNRLTSKAPLLMSGLFVQPEATVHFGTFTGSYSNRELYPIYLDFFKEISILYRDISYLKKKNLVRNVNTGLHKKQPGMHKKGGFCVTGRRWFSQKPDQQRSGSIKQFAGVLTFYYQLKSQKVISIK